MKSYEDVPSQIDLLLLRPDLHNFPRVLLLELILEEPDVSTDVLVAILKLRERRLEDLQSALGRNHLIQDTETQQQNSVITHTPQFLSTMSCNSLAEQDNHYV